ncbi:ArsO family NAD(P)H-dependent flavin-containing monooxygenase [Janibacter cremeus]|uniref:ArsO family NAD(P)H-dependent flavin-containing monooxygenase n=1 Tax=Janibacter cremeus TaxID=1285192 RepID=UPI0023F78B35|nr:ArsO family NAD(P)H-dependent flavin-containing monooxygenase [Janibacter cremeus]WEV77833.1 ArsO family NAD(P)H-dependent flavin-containing monooxygenase [Janibacter cremeus]
MTSPSTDATVRTVVVGAGQSGLATGFYLRRYGLEPGVDFVILDAADRPGGAWRHMWEGLRLFSPASASALPGWPMPPWDDAAKGYPPARHVVDYLTRYEERYDLKVRRPFTVTAVEDPDDGSRRLLVRGSGGTIATETVVSTTGTWARPFWPTYPGMARFTGRQLHAAQYRRPEDFAGQRVAIVGGGNSAAQVLAEVSTVATTVWVTVREPRFLPDDLDGRALFATARRRIEALQEGREDPGIGGLGDIVMVPSVRQARDRGVLEAHPAFAELTEHALVWADGSSREVDTVIWCTGFRPALRHLRPLRLRGEDGRVAVGRTPGTQALDDPRVFLVGYGDWTGPASATLVGVGPSARATAAVIAGADRPGAGSAKRSRTNSPS